LTTEVPCCWLTWPVYLLELSRTHICMYGILSVLPVLVKVAFLQQGSPKRPKVVVSHDPLALYGISVV
jgi:hypothetical protein